MGANDLPMINQPSDSTKIDVPAVRVVKPAPEVRRSPASELRRPAAPAPAAAAQDPRAASEARKAGTVTPKAPAPAAQESTEDEDAEKLLREYTERQKTKVLRLEQQVVEQKKVAAERDAFRAKAESLAKELQDSRRQLEGSAKSEEVIKDLQGKLDAALLSHTMATDEVGKLKAKVHEYADVLRKSEARASQFEKSLHEAQAALKAQSDGRKEAESRVAAALQALQGASPVDSAVTRPVPSASRPPEAAPKAAAPAPARPAPAVIRK